VELLNRVEPDDCGDSGDACAAGDDLDIGGVAAQRSNFGTRGAFGTELRPEPGLV